MRDDGGWETRAARMDGVEKWADSGSVSKAELTGFGNQVDVWNERRNSRARLRFGSRDGRMERPSTEKTQTARGVCLGREGSGGREFGFELGGVE